MKTLEKQFYGDNVRWFTGIVVDHTPPIGFEGRVRVRIHGVHDPRLSMVPEKDLPWAQVIIPTTEGGISGIGRTPQLLSGALVFGFFADGVSSQIPLVLGSLPRTEYPTAQQTIGSENTEQVVPIFASEGLTGEPQRKRRRSEAMKFFIDNGYTVEQAAGIVGNLDFVSKFNPRFDTNNSGIAKWNNFDARELKVFAKYYLIDPLEQNPSYLKFPVQLNFILHQLRTTDVTTNGKLLRSKKVVGKDGSAMIVKQYYMNNTETSLYNDILELCLLARNEVLA
jgi:hypothetical protein